MHVLRFVQHYIAEKVFLNIIKKLFTFCLNSSNFILHTYPLTTNVSSKFSQEKSVVAIEGFDKDCELMEIQANVIIKVFDKN